VAADYHTRCSLIHGYVCAAIPTVGTNPYTEETAERVHRMFAADFDLGYGADSWTS